MIGYLKYKLILNNQNEKKVHLEVFNIVVIISMCI